MEDSKIDYSKLTYRSGDLKYFNFNDFWPLSSVYLKLTDGDIGINVVKLRLKEFEGQINRLKVKKPRIEPYKTNKKSRLK